MDCILNDLIIPIIGLDKVTTMMANTMLAMTSAMTTAKMMKIQTCANAITHGDVLATMEMTTMSLLVCYRQTPDSAPSARYRKGQR